MSMDPSLKLLLNQTVSLRSPSGYTPSGDETFSVAVSRKAYIEHRRMIAIHLEGEQLKLKTFLVLDAEEGEVSKDDLFYLPGTDVTSRGDGVLPDKVTIYYSVFDGSPSHYEVQL